MIDVEIIIYLIASFILGLIASWLAFYAKKYPVEGNKDFLRFYSLATLILALGFFVHTCGDFFGLLYDSEEVAHIIESGAHVILFISFLLYALASVKIMKASKQY